MSEDGLNKPFDWRDYLNQETLEWLLEPSNPGVAYYTQTNILDRRQDDEEIIRQKNQIMETNPVKKILSHQNPDGNFLSESMESKRRIIPPRYGYLPKYKGTVWQAIFLAQLGADKNDERIKKLGASILNTNYSEELKVLGFEKQTKNMDEFTTIPCFVANMVWALSTLGFYEDSRIQQSIKWLIKYQRFDDGTFKTPNTWPYRGRKDRCFGKHSCYIGCTQAIKAMTCIPREEQKNEIPQVIRKGIDFIIHHRIFKKSKNKRVPIRKEYESLWFPMTYFDDIVQILETLLHFKVRHQAIDETIDFILKKQNNKSRWNLEKTINPSSMYAKIEEKAHESKWITYRVIHLLKKYAEA